jgi:hypothetical protein
MDSADVCFENLRFSVKILVIRDANRRAAVPRYRCAALALAQFKIFATAILSQKSRVFERYVEPEKFWAKVG